MISNDAVKMLWDAGFALEAGCLLFERLPYFDRPHWAVRILDLCSELTDPIPEVETVSAIARDPARWVEAQDAFHATRRVVLREERAGDPDPLRESVLLLAENVAKVSHNALIDINPLKGLAPMARFDADAGWWIVRILRDIVDSVPDPVFAERAWTLACWQR